jgi:hypothetical protein
MAIRPCTSERPPDMSKSLATAAAIAAASLLVTHGSALAQQTLHEAYADLKAASFVIVVRLSELVYASHRSQASIFGADRDEDLDLLHHRVAESIVARIALRTARFSVGDVVAISSYNGHAYLYVDDLPGS